MVLGSASVVDEETDSLVSGPMSSLALLGAVVVPIKTRACSINENTLHNYIRIVKKRETLRKIITQNTC